MIHIAVCDDNAQFLKKLTGYIDEILHEKTEYFLTKCINAKQLLAAGPQDIVFLDIGMNGMDGMEAARTLREHGDSCRLVFLTAYPNYVFEAFDVEASHFLTKPVDLKKLREVLLHLVERLSEDTHRFLTVRQGTKVSRIALADILYMEVFDHRIWVHTSKACLDFNGKLERLEQQFPDEFFRCHRSYLVHFAGIRQYDQREITMENGEQIPIARRKYSEFCRSFLHYLQRGGELP